MAHRSFEFWPSCSQPLVGSGGASSGICTLRIGPCNLSCGSAARPSAASDTCHLWGITFLLLFLSSSWCHPPTQDEELDASQGVKDRDEEREVGGKHRKVLIIEIVQEWDGWGKG